MFDIDGTLFDHRHRLHLLPPEGGGKWQDYKKYHDKHVEDEPIAHMWQGLKMYVMTGCSVNFLTRRPACYFDSTVVQLSKEIDRLSIRLPNVEEVLTMADVGDRTEHNPYKKKRLLKIMDMFPHIPVEYIDLDVDLATVME
jgi:hypothetical protein